MDQNSQTPQPQPDNFAFDVFREINHDLMLAMASPSLPENYQIDQVVHITKAEASRAQMQTRMHHSPLGNCVETLTLKD